MEGEDHQKGAVCVCNSIHTHIHMHTHSHVFTQDLDMIKVREEEENVLSHVIRKKTYKGDVEIETPDKDDIIEVSHENIYSCHLLLILQHDCVCCNLCVLAYITIQTIPTAEKEAAAGSSNASSNAPDDSTPKTPTKTAVTKTGSKSKGQADSKLASSSKGGGILDLLTNTTSQHAKHVFDQHCDICTGKIKAPPASTEPTTTIAATTDDRYGRVYSRSLIHTERLVLL